MTPENLVRVGDRQPSAYFRAMESAASNHDTIIVEARGIHIAKAYDTAQGFSDRYDTWRVSKRYLGSTQHNGRIVSEAIITLNRIKEENTNGKEDR